MDTSKVIKQGQKEKHTVTRTGNGVFETSSRDGSHKHTVKRINDHFWCDCPSQSLCHHIIDVIGTSASGRGYIPSFWTSEEDAERQKKRKIRFYASGKSFWVTYRNIPRQLIAVRRGWGNEGWELIYRKADGKHDIQKVDSVNLEALREKGFRSSDGLDWFLSN